MQADLPAERSIAYHTDATRDGNQDGHLKYAALRDPMGTGHVAIAVSGEETREHARKRPTPNFGISNC